MSDAYLLPPGNVQIAFSGGRTSAFMLHEILMANGGLPSSAAVVFSNTGAEHPATLDFVAEVADRWSVPITWVEYTIGGNSGTATFRTVCRRTASTDAAPFEAAIRKRGFLPNVRTRFCSTELKSRTAGRFLRDASGWVRWHTALGIRADEPRRLEKTVLDDAGRVVAPRYRDRGRGWYPMALAGVTRRDVETFWRKQPFGLRLPSHDGKTPAGNCVGCFLKSEQTIATMWRDHPDLMAWWMEIEDRRGATFSKRYSHRQMAEVVQKQGSMAFSVDGFFCQSEGGDCTG